MCLIKQIPEDFIVIEKPVLKFDLEGKSRGYSYYKLKKRDYTTIDAVSKIAEKLRIPAKRIGFAGNKDKRAVTEQYISIQNTNIKSISLPDLSLELVGYGEKPISLGDLKGNEFIITVRDISSMPKIPSKIRMLNLFDRQRFSANNADIGKAIIKRDFEKAVELILQGRGAYENVINDYIKKKPADFIGAIRTMPKKILTLYINSYQSMVWNMAALSFKSSKTGFKLPIVGFGTEFESKKIQAVFDKLMAEDSIKQRDFIIKELPELSSEGNDRDLFVHVENITCEAKEDELNRGKKKAIIGFSLPKSSYATMVIRELFKDIKIE